MGIKSKDISIVVQGAIDKKETKRCLKSIRKHLPKAEIILSTWKDSDVSGLEYDVLVENDDPGAIIQEKDTKLLNNINRQLVSTQNGLKKANRKYTLKFRTDFYLKGNRFLNFFDKFPKTNEKYFVFKHRVIVCSVYSREFSTERKNIKTPLHPSDFYLFGLTEDVKSYFENIPFMKEEDMANYPYKYKERKPFIACTFRYPPEQYFCLCFAKRYFPNIQFDDWTDWNRDLNVFSKNFIYSNFIFLGGLESQIYSNKHNITILFDEKNTKGLISYRRFVNNYRRMFDMSFKNQDNSFEYIYDKVKSNIKIKLISYKQQIINICWITYYNFF